MQAPGVNVECAANVGDNSQQLTGTSFAAIIVSGLAAYFRALDPEGFQKPGTGRTARAVKSRIIQEAYARENLLEDPDLVYTIAISNRLESPICGSNCGSESGSEGSKIRRRDTIDGDSCPRLSSTVLTSSSTTATPTTTSVASSASNYPSPSQSKACNNRVRMVVSPGLGSLLRRGLRQTSARALFPTLRNVLASTS